MDQVREHPAGLQQHAIIEVARRAVVLLFLIAAAVAAFGHGQWLWAALAFALAVLVYAFVPRPLPPHGALHHERLPSVFMPDLVGFLLATTFLALPFVIAAREPWQGGPWALMLFMWPPGLVALSVLWLSIRYQCFWVKLSADGLTVSTIRGIEVLPFERIAGARAETGRPPRWLGPLLVLLGGWRGLGIALLHADSESHAVLIERSDGTTLRLPADAFPGLNKVTAALRAADIPVEPPSGGAVLRDAPASPGILPGRRRPRRPQPPPSAR
jgi:hypothetical protein